jgi:hypothetical protein
MTSHVLLFVIAVSVVAIGSDALARAPVKTAPQVAVVVPRSRLPVDAAHRQVRLTKLPEKNGKVDIVRLTLDSSGIGESVTRNLTAAQKQEVRAQIDLMRKGKFAKSLVRWRKLVLSLRGGRRPVDLDAVLLYILRKGFLARFPRITAAADIAAKQAAKVSSMQARVRKLRADQARCRSRRGSCAEKQSQNLTQALSSATKQLQEMQMSFNLQYLMLQNKISHENRQFTMVSNIMKNKHDTAKNSINNIR